MKRYFITIITAIFTIALCNISIAASNEFPIEATVLLDSIDQLEILYESDVIITSRRGLQISVIGNDGTLKILKAMGLNPTIIDDPSDTKGYHTYESINSLLEGYAETFPDLTDLFELAISPQGNSVMAIKISDNAGKDELEPALLYEFNIHGDEKISAEVAVCFLDHIFQGYGNDDAVTEIVDNNELFIIPILNPDGHIFDIRYNGGLVDLNRNFGWWWDGTGGTPASQPEVAAIMGLAFEQNFMFALSFHSGAELVNYPFDAVSFLAPDDEAFQYISTVYGDAGGYPITNGFDWYKVNGISEESYYGSNGSMAVIIEISNKKAPAATRIPEYCDRNLAAIMQWTALAESGVHGTVIDALSGSPVGARITPIQGGWPAWTDTVTGDFHRYTLPGTYDFLIEANGFEPELLDNVVVGAGAPANIDTALERTTGVQPAFFANKVLMVQTPRPIGNYDNDSLPIAALGPADDNAFSLGAKGWIVLDTGRNSSITKVDGADFVVYENDSDGSEFYDVYGSMGGWRFGADLSPYVFIGSGTGTTQFDLPDELESVRYLYIVDTSEQGSASATAGADIDAVEHNVQCPRPVADFDSDVTGGDAPLEVNFAAIVNDDEQCLSDYEWDFGDGEKGFSDRASHVYNEPGVYTVSMTAKGAGGSDTKRIEDYITVTGDDSDDDDDDLDSGEDDDSNDGFCCG